MDDIQKLIEGYKLMDRVDKLRAVFPRGSADFFKANETKTHSKLPNPKPKHYEATALERVAKGEEKSLGRVTLRYRLFRVRLLDYENFAGSTKDLTDGLCRCGLLPGDDPSRVTIITEQEKVDSYSRERTEIEIEWPD